MSPRGETSAAGIGYTLDEHRHRFAAWAAARAAQRGFATVGDLISALESSDIRAVLGSTTSLELREDQFDVHHRRWCQAIVAKLTDLGVHRPTYGRAAKLVAVYVKVAVILAGSSNTSLGRVTHPPIDSILLRRLSGLRPELKALRTVRWTQLTEAEYAPLVASLREIAGSAPFWTIEEHWTPTDDA